MCKKINLYQLVILEHGLNKNLKGERPAERKWILINENELSTWQSSVFPHWHCLLDILNLIKGKVTMSRKQKSIWDWGGGGLTVI